MIMQKSQIYDNLSLTYFYGTNGIPVIPNIRCGDDDLLPEFLEAIPKKSMIAIGTHGFCKEMRGADCGRGSKLKRDYYPCHKE